LMDAASIEAMSAGLFLHTGASLNATDEAISAWTDSSRLRFVTSRAFASRAEVKAWATCDLNCKNMVISVLVFKGV